jgi:hypothetical protein
VRPPFGWTLSPASGPFAPSPKSPSAMAPARPSSWICGLVMPPSVVVFVLFSRIPSTQMLMSPSSSTRASWEILGHAYLELSWRNSFLLAPNLAPLSCNMMNQINVQVASLTTCYQTSVSIPILPGICRLIRKQGKSGEARLPSSARSSAGWLGVATSPPTRGASGIA